MNKFISFLSMSLVLTSLANMGPQGFGDFVNEYFVETGTFGGDSIDKALTQGFKQIRSLEAVDLNYIGAKDRFKDKENVQIFHADSSTGLWDVIKDINTPITFWLDAHIFPAIEGAKNCPLLEELEQIKRHAIKTHTILIDDMHRAGSEAFDGITKEDLIIKILEINPNYSVYYVPGGNEGEYPENVMVARIIE